MRIHLSIVRILLVLFLFAPNPLVSAELSATYVESFDTTVQTGSSVGVGDRTVIPVGTLTIRPSDGLPFNIYGIHLERSGNFAVGTARQLIGTDKTGKLATQYYQLIAKTTYGIPSTSSIVNPIELAFNSLYPLITMDTVITKAQYNSASNPITVQFFITLRGVNGTPSVKDIKYQFKDGAGPNIGDFTVKYRLTSTPGTEYTIPINGSSSPRPFYSVNYNQGSVNYLNSGVTTIRFVSLSIDQSPEQAIINLLDATSSIVTIGSVRITLEGYISGSTAGVTIAFADGNGSTDTNFRLKHSVLPSYIPFSLYLGGIKANRGVPITWAPLDYGPNNLKVLGVGGINYLVAEAAIAGAYSDTITVTITPVDSTLIGL